MGREKWMKNITKLQSTLNKSKEGKKGQKIPEKNLSEMLKKIQK